MAKMWEEGIRVRDEGGVWIEDHNDTWQLNRTTKQTFIQRESMPVGCPFIVFNVTHP